ALGTARAPGVKPPPCPSFYAPEPRLALVAEPRVGAKVPLPPRPTVHVGEGVLFLLPWLPAAYRLVGTGSRSAAPGFRAGGLPGPQATANGRRRSTGDAGPGPSRSLPVPPAPGRRWPAPTGPGPGAPYRGPPA